VEGLLGSLIDVVVRSLVNLHALLGAGLFCASTSLWVDFIAEGMHVDVARLQSSRGLIDETKSLCVLICHFQVGLVFSEARLHRRLLLRLHFDVAERVRVDKKAAVMALVVNDALR